MQVNATMAIPANYRTLIVGAATFVLGVAVTAGANYVSNKETNTAMVIQQQQVADLSQFGATGAALDRAMSQFSDALADGKGVEAARTNLKAAVVDHSSFVFNNMRDVMGPTDSAVYMADLRALGEAAQAARTYEDGVQVFQQTINLITYRKKTHRSHTPRH